MPWLLHCLPCINAIESLHIGISFFHQCPPVHSACSTSPVQYVPADPDPDPTRTFLRRLTLFGTGPLDKCMFKLTCSNKQKILNLKNKTGMPFLHSKISSSL